MHQRIYFYYMILSVSSVLYGMHEHPVHEVHRNLIKNYYHHLYPIDLRGQRLVTAYYDIIQKNTYVMVKDAALNYSLLEIDMYKNVMIKKNVFVQEYNSRMRLHAIITLHNNNHKALNIAPNPVTDPLVAPYTL